MFVLRSFFALQVVIFHPLHFSHFGPRWTPSSGAQRVAEYCWVPPLPKRKMSSETEAAEAQAAADDFQRQSLDINMTLLVRDSLAALVYAEDPLDGA